MNLFKDYKSFSKNSGIYKITTLHNNKIYIGSSICLQKRQKDHINDLKRNKHYIKYLQRIFNKYGEDNFKIEFLFISQIKYQLNSKNHKKLIVLEEVLINKLKADYNTDKTPTKTLSFTTKINSKIIYQYDINGNFIKEWSSASEVLRQLNIQPQNSLKGSNRSSGGFMWTFSKHDNLPKYTANQGSYGNQKITIHDIWGHKIKTFSCIKDCCLEIFPDKELSKIRQMISKYSKDGRVLHNYRFSYGDNNKLDNSINLKHRINFIVVQYDLKMNFIQIYPTLQEAQKLSGIKSIYDNLSGKTKQAGGFIWQKLNA
jgi:group I intron endonuclease